MTESSEPGAGPRRAKRVDAFRNEQKLLDAAASVFVEVGVDAPVRAVAAAAGVGVGTIYRHFPTRADLVVAVYRHQVDMLAAAGPSLLATSGSPDAAVRDWLDQFVDFLVTKHGLAAALQDDKVGAALHQHFVDHLVPVCAELLAAATKGSGGAGLTAYEVLRGVGNLCIGAGQDPMFDTRRVVRAYVSGVLIGEDVGRG
ncbi:TetR/AcrR family transcriptional regulator [Aeromicrobium endophyticum]|uniref:TetR/AcrR family transcriptional regulator n=1 Tax=Aeromicrobium endophyticum TaxID=2292704 RepID=A0A371PF48_9ACTN|nr:TetR/AcrR family transcriptional regulator [Aeromicrobium endophyticum]REK74030.1 TetR/AcrR family transcriptional regulator [Aeromicrobium endophyticum]